MVAALNSSTGSFIWGTYYAGLNLVYFDAIWDANNRSHIIFSIDFNYI